MKLQIKEITNAKTLEEATKIFSEIFRNSTDKKIKLEAKKAYENRTENQNDNDFNDFMNEASNSLDEYNKDVKLENSKF